MRQHGSRLFIGLLVLLVSALIISGCAGRKMKRRAEITASLQTVQSDIEYAQLKTRETREALNGVVLSHEADLWQAYETLSDRVNKMSGAGGRLIRHADGMYYRGSSYLVEPEASATECKYPRLSESSGTRPLELGDAFQPIAEESVHVKRAYRAFEFDMTAIRDSLSRDLTPRAVDTMTTMFRKAHVDSDSLKTALEEMLASVQEAKSAPQQGAPAGGEQR